MFYNKPQIDTSATDVLVVHPTTHEIGTLPINSLVSSSHGNNMWYESWHMTTENIDASNNYANIGKRVYYHGFRAHKTGEYTNMKVRIQDITGTANPILTMNVAIYDSSNQSSVIDAAPYPNVLQGDGSGNFLLGNSNYGTHSFLDISFDSPISVTRGNIYFVALFYNGGIDGLFGLGSNKTGSGSYSLSYSSSAQSINSFVPTIPTIVGNYLEPNDLAAYWFTLYGPETATGSTSGSSGPINSTISFFSDFHGTGGGMSNMSTFPLTPVSKSIMGVPILPHGSGAMASITGRVMDISINTINPLPLFAYGAYMPRDGEIYCAAINYNYKTISNGSKQIIAINYTKGNISNIYSLATPFTVGSAHTTFSPTISFSQGDHIGIAIQNATAPSVNTDEIVVEGTLFLKLT